MTHVDSSIEMSFQKMLESRNIDEKVYDSFIMDTVVGFVCCVCDSRKKLHNKFSPFRLRA